MYIIAAQQQGVGSILPSLVMMALVFGVFYFMLIRPQKKQQKKFQDTMNELKVGDQIVTRGGVRGKIVELKADSFVIQSGNTQIEFLKQALSYVEDPTKQSNEGVNSEFQNVPVQPLPYGNDKRFSDKLDELKSNINEEIEYDLLLEDVYEFIVIEDKASVKEISNTFRLSEGRATEIMNQLALLGVVGESTGTDYRQILVDPR
ncbi:preprotein translocase subunit YajC [Helcococcus sueciensis]|uniref:preprotein translocase subunit YajC n=1 Tax=Helcococcus sueciensis TaxID=241555 RepID=UPI0004160050|nr:preprotein translocase subunit YajC [Helcococcus sueciensis]